MIWVKWAFNLRHFTAWFEPFYRVICIISSHEMHQIARQTDTLQDFLWSLRFHHFINFCYFCRRNRNIFHMKILFRFSLMALLCMALSACFKDEAPNAECDIEAAFVSVDQATDVFNNLSDTLVAVPSTSTDIVFAKVSARSLRHNSSSLRGQPLFRQMVQCTTSAINPLFIRSRLKTKVIIASIGWASKKTPLWSAIPSNLTLKTL